MGNIQKPSYKFRAKVYKCARCEKPSIIGWDSVWTFSENGCEVVVCDSCAGVERELTTGDLTAESKQKLWEVIRLWE